MGVIVDRAEELAELLSSDTYKATCDIRDTVPPCLLVVPVPQRDYREGVLAGGTVDLAWTIVALGRPPADLQAGRDLEDLTDQVLEALPYVELAEPATYQIPGAETAVPAYLITYRETINT